MDEARRDAVTFLPRAREVANPQTLIPALTQAAFAFAAGGELGAAVTLAVEYEASGARAAGGFPYPLLPTMLRICVAAGELPLAQSLVDGTADAFDTPVSLHAATTGRAILAEARGRTEEAAALYAAAAAGWAEWGSVVERAYALLGLGRCGDSDAAREGAAIFERLDAVPFTALAA